MHASGTGLHNDQKSEIHGAKRKSKINKSKIGVFCHPLLRQLRDLLLSAIAQSARRIGQRYPFYVADLLVHFRRYVAESAASVTEQVETDDLEDTRVIAPG